MMADLILHPLGMAFEHRAYHRALRDMHESFHGDRDGYQTYYYARLRYYRSYGGW